MTLSGELRHALLVAQHAPLKVNPLASSLCGDVADVGPKKVGDSRSAPVELVVR